MSNIQISKHNFEVSKNRIKELLDKVPDKADLPQLKTSYFFGLIDKSVTGAEMNDITNSISRSFVNYNQQIITIKKEFVEIYNALETLDKEYIQGIIIATNEAKEASKQAKVASSQAEKNSLQAERISLQAERNSKQAGEISLQAKKACDKAKEALDEALTAQSDIKKIIEALKISVSKLERTKEEFFILKKHFERIEECFFINSNGITQLKSIGEIVKKVDEQELGISSLTIKFNNIEEVTKKTHQGFKGMIDELQKYHFQLKKLEHLIEVDSIWEDVNTIKLDLANQIRSIDNLERYTQSSFSKINEEILILKEYKFELEQYNHLKDIDEIWENTEKHHRLLDFLDTQLSQTKVDLTNLNSAMTKSFQETHTEINSKSNLYEKRLRIAHWVAGGALFLALLQFVLLMFKVL